MTLYDILIDDEADRFQNEKEEDVTREESYLNDKWNAIAGFVLE